MGAGAGTGRTLALDRVPLVLPPVPQSGRWELGLRAVIAVALLVGWVQNALQPAERSVDDLVAELSTGSVHELTIERLPEGAVGSGTFRVEWTGGSGRGEAAYEFSNMGGSPRVDEGAIILAAAERSPAPVDVSIVDHIAQPSGTVWNVAAIAALAALGLLVLGPQPRLATKWAWFWVACAVGPLWLAFVLLEPVPWWRRDPAEPPRRRLTGGWAFLAALLLGPFVASMLDGAHLWSP